MVDMKLKVWNEANIVKKPTVYLQLVEDGDGIILQAVDKYGENLSYLLHLCEGYIRRAPYVDKSLGFHLDERGHIKLDDV